MKTVDDIIDEIILREDRTGKGVYTDDPNDAGGPTRWGITQKTLEDYLGRKVTKEDVKSLPRELAEEIYRDTFIAEPKINHLPIEIQANVADAGVMSGPKRAIIMLQEVCTMAGFPCGTDGKVGPETRRQVQKAYDSMKGFLNNAYVERRIHYYEYLAENEGPNDKDKKWINGWRNRANEFRVEV